MNSESKKILYIGNFLSKHGNTPNFNVYLTDFFLEIGIETIPISNKINKIQRFFDMVFAPFRYKKFVKICIIDVFSSSAFWFAFSTSIICRIIGMKYITILHGGNLPLRLKNNPFLCKLFFSNSYKNISPSEYLLKEFEDKGYLVEFIPNFVDLEKYLFLERSEIQAPKLLWVRAFSETYNPIMAIDVVKKLKKNFADVHLTMVGPDNGSLNECLEQIESFDLKSNVTITGRLSLDEWKKLSETCNIFINTTNFDNMPVSIIEAMSLGFPIISTNVGGIPFIIKNLENGILVGKNDSSKMSAQIENLVNDSQLVRKLSTAAYDSSKLYDKKINLLKWKAILDNV